MPFPGSTDWPSSVDVAYGSGSEREDGIHVVYDNDFNFPDIQIRQLQTWLGTTGALIGAGIASEGPGGMASPVANGGTAFQFAARAAFSSGKIFSFGDDYDSSYAEKFFVEHNGIMGIKPVGTLPSPGVQGRIAYKSGAGEGLYADDGLGWNAVGSAATGGVVTPEDYGAIGDGIVDDRTAIYNAVTALDGIGGGELHLIGTSTYRVGSAVSIPDSVVLVERGGVLVPDNTVTITVYSPYNINASGQIFDLTNISTSGGIAWDEGGEVRPQWFGAVGDGVSDDLAPFEAADDSIPASGGVILCSPGVYRFGDDITITNPLRMVDTAVLAPDDTKTVTVGVVDAASVQVFDVTACVTSGGVTFTAAQEIDPLWWNRSTVGTVVVPNGCTYRVPTRQAVAYSTPITPDPWLGQIIDVGALTGNLVINAPDADKTFEGERLTFLLTQDGVGGRTVTFNAAFAFTWSDTGNAANAKASVSFVYDGSNWEVVEYLDWGMESGSGTSFWERSGTVLSPLTNGDTVQAGVGAAGAPAYAFESDATTGMYQAGAGAIALSCAGVTRFSIDGTNSYFYDASAKVIHGFYRTDPSPASPYDVGTFKFWGKDNANSTTEWAWIHAYVSDVGASTKDARLEFHTVVNATLADRVTIAGGLIVGDNGTISDPGHGNVNVETSIFTGNGAVGTPAYTFRNDPNTGIYCNGSDYLIFGAGGAQKALVYPYGFAVIPGEVTHPSLTFIDAQGTTGLYSTGLGVIDFAASAVRTATLNQSMFTKTQVGAGSLRVADTSAAASAKIIGTVEFQAYDSNPTETVFASMTGYCLTHTHAAENGQIYFSTYTAGVPADRMTIGGGVIVGDNGTVSDPGHGHLAAETAIYTGDGAAATPSFGFRSETTTGMYRAGAGAIGLACSGSISTYFDNASLVKYSTTNVIYDLFSTTAATGGPVSRTIGYIRYRGYDSAGGQVFGSIVGQVHNDLNGAEDASVYVSTAYGGAETERMRIRTGVMVGPGLNDPGAGHLAVQFEVLAGDGAVGSPSYSFRDDPTTGIFSSSNGIVDFASAGYNSGYIDRYYWLKRASAGVPYMGTQRYENHGVVDVGTFGFWGYDDIGGPVAWGYITGTCLDNVSTSKDSAILIKTYVANNFAERLRVGGGVMVGSSLTDPGPGRLSVQYEIHAGDGAVGTPAFSFASNTTTGIYQTSAGYVDFASSSVRVASINADGLTFQTLGTTNGDISFVARTGDPSAPADGELWYNTTDDVFRYYDGAGTRTLITDSEGGFWTRSGTDLYPTTTGDEVQARADGIATFTAYDSEAFGVARTIGKLAFEARTNPSGTAEYAAIESYVSNDAVVSYSGDLLLKSSFNAVLATRMTLRQGVMVGTTTDPGHGHLAVENGVLVGDGTNAAPSLSFRSQTNLGLYRSGSQQLSLAMSGLQYYIWSVDAFYATGFYLKRNTGSAAAPSYAFLGATDTGIYNTGSTELNFTVGGTRRTYITTSAIISNTGYSYYINHGAGGPTVPTYSFGSDVQTGMYRSGAGEISFASGGAQAHIMDSAGALKSATATGAYFLRGAAGSGAAPSFAFTGDQDTGMYRSADGQIGFATNAFTSAIIQTGGLTVRRDGGYASIGTRRVDEHGSSQYTGVFSFYGRNSTPADFLYAYIANYVLDHTAGDEDSRLEFHTTVAGAESCRMDIGQGVIIGDHASVTDPGTGHLAVQNEILVGNGLLSAPSYSFRGETNTGLYWLDAGRIAFATAGSLGMWLSSTEMRKLRNAGAATLSLERTDLHGGTSSVAVLDFVGQDSGDTSTIYAEILGYAQIATHPTEYGSLLFYTMRNGTLSEGARLAQGLMVGSSLSDPGAGHLAVQNNVRVGDGAVGGPSLSFRSATNTGLYYVAGPVLSVAVNGANVFNFQTVGLVSPTATGPYLHFDGITAASPSYTFNGDGTTGIYNHAGGQIGLSCGGATSAVLSSTTLYKWANAAIPVVGTYRTDVHNSAATVGIVRFTGQDSGDADAVYAEIVGYCVDDTAGGEDGEIQFFTAKTTGALGERMAIGGGVMIGTGITDAGAGTLAVQTAIYNAYGTSAVPPYTFNGDGQTGIYHYSTAQIGFTCGAIPVGYFYKNTTTGTTGGLRLADGTVALPALSWISDTDTGFWRKAADQTGISTGGQETGYLGKVGLVSEPGGHPVDAQDETDYDDTPNTEGTFSGGTGHAALDVITMSDGTKVTVDAVSGGVVTEFTVDSVSSTGYIRSVGGLFDGDTITQSSTTGSGVNFSMTLGEDNVEAPPLIRLDHTGVVLEHTSAYTGALGYLSWVAPDAAFQQRVWGDIQLTGTAFGEGTEDSDMSFRAMENSTLYTPLRLTGQGAYFLDGIVGAPSIAFSSDEDTGIYMPTTAQIGFACAAGQRALLSQYGWYVVDGSASLPSHSFISDTDAGMYKATYNGEDTIGIATAGTARSYTNIDGVKGDPGCYDTLQAVTSNAGSTDVDLRDGFITYQLLTENTTYETPTNAEEGMILTVICKQAAASSYTVQFTSAFLLAGGSYGMTSTNNSIDVLRFVYVSTLTKWVEISRSQDVK